jgi:deoxyribodipyrimidine photo-lyase
MNILFIYRRDLRVNDNTSLNLIKSKYPQSKILPIFIFNKNQIDEKINKYYSSNAVQFMFECLEELHFINYYHTLNEIEVIEKLHKKYNFSVIAYNKDYTPYAKKRDLIIEKWANKNNIKIVSEEDYTLHNMGEITKDDKKPYLKFTPFYKKAILKKPRAIVNFNFNFIKDDNSFSYKEMEKIYKPKINDKINVRGGRNNALIIIKTLKNGKFNKYDEERDYPYLDKTTKLSAYIKFGCISIREVYYALPLRHGIVRELFWRDFYAIIGYYFPYVFEKSYILKYNNIKWNINNDYLNKWKNGLTGFPLIDAAMRQLNICGWMHNRCRMIVASFLVKNLFINWRSGEEYFASKLVDYDPSSNNGGWQWCASTGTDSQPYFRIFSPSAQLKKYDNECLFVKKWVPELRDIPNHIILKWENIKNYNLYNYPKPMVNIKTTSATFIKRFKEIVENS